MALLTYLYNHADRELLESFHFIFTGGTHDRVFYGHERRGISALDATISDWYRASCGVTRLRGAKEGGVSVLSYLVCQRQCSIVWPFFAPYGAHWLRPENLSLLRLCDLWHGKKLMNPGSVLAWFENEAAEDALRNRQACPPQLVLMPGEEPIPLRQPPGRKGFSNGQPVRTWSTARKNLGDMTIALIAHDAMKQRIIDFAIDHEAELRSFGRILATGTTGREVAANTSREIDGKMIRYHSGPKGGDIEIATVVLYGHCDVVIFFLDPLNPHPHIEDIRVVFEACMLKDEVVMITSEMHAREFMSRVVRGKDSFVVYSTPSAASGNEAVKT